MAESARKRPFAGSATARVWEIADELFRRTGVMPSGVAVTEAYLNEDPSRNKGTCQTQYSHWKAHHLNHFKRPRTTAEPNGNAVAVRITIGSGGQVVIPANLLHAAGVVPGEAIIASVTDGGLRFVSAQAALRQARALVKTFDSGAGSPVDELIAERRHESGRE